MNQPLRETLKVEAKRAVLVGMVSPGASTNRELALDELAGLAETAGCEIVGTLIQAREKPDPATYLGKGKIAELKQLMAMTQADLAIFDNNLAPSQGRNIETAIKAIVIDRSEVILDIFATHARTYEAKLQVELAQLLYMRPRLKRMWTHLERIEGGIGSGRGPGEKQLELDKRLLDKRVSELKRKLATVERRRERLVSARREKFTVSLVGYTNAGKSTLMKALTGEDVLIADQLFATLDTKTRTWSIPNGGRILLSDTVGFVRDLPHHLVASFKSTLEETLQADLLLHVVDAGSPEAMQHIETVEKVLEEIGAGDKETLLVLNKIDRLPDLSLSRPENESENDSKNSTQKSGETSSDLAHSSQQAEERTWYDILRHKYRDSISVSAVTGKGIDTLQNAVIERLSQSYQWVDIVAHAGDGKFSSLLASSVQVEQTTYDENNHATFRCRLPTSMLQRLEQEYDIQVLPVTEASHPQHDSVATPN